MRHGRVEIGSREIALGADVPGSGEALILVQAIHRRAAGREMRPRMDLLSTSTTWQHTCTNQKQNLVSIKESNIVDA
jgi:hypothetical protein